MTGERIKELITHHLENDDDRDIVIPFIVDEIIRDGGKLWPNDVCNLVRAAIEATREYYQADQSHL